MAGKSKEKEIDYRKKWHLQTGPSAQRSAERHKIVAKLPKVQTTKKRADRAATATSTRAEVTANRVQDRTALNATRPPKSRKKTQGNSANSRGVKRRRKV